MRLSPLLQGTLALFLLAAPAARAASDVVVPHMGRLMKSGDGGDVAVSGNVKLKVGLYKKSVDAAGDQNLVWEDTFAEVLVSNGIYALELGAGPTPLSIDDLGDGSSLWLDVTLFDPADAASGVNLKPRMRLAANPISHYANNAGKLGGKVPADYLLKSEFEQFKTDLTGGSEGGLTIPWAQVSGIPEDFQDGKDDGLLQVAGTGAIGGKGTGEEPLKVNERGILTPMLGDGAVDGTKLAAGAVGSAHLSDGAVGAGQLAADAVETAKIRNGAVTAEKLASNAVTPSAFEDRSIGLLKLANPDTTCSNGDVLKWNGNRWACGADAGGSSAPVNTSAPLTFVGGVLTLSDGGISTAKTADGAITTAKLADGAVTNAKMADAAVATAELADNAVTSAKIAADAVEAADLKGDAASLAKVTGGAAVVAGGLVGVGTTSPAYRLDVANQAAATGNGTFNITANSQVAVLSQAAGAQISVGDIVAFGNLGSRLVTAVSGANVTYAYPPLSTSTNNNGITFTVTKPTVRLGAGALCTIAADNSIGIGTNAATFATMQFANALGNRIGFWDGSATDRFGFGLDNGTLAAFVPVNGRFALKQNGYNGAEMVTLGGTGYGHFRSTEDNILRLQTTDDAWLYTAWHSANGTRRLWMGLDANLATFNITPENGTNAVNVNNVILNANAGLHVGKAGSSPCCGEYTLSIAEVTNSNNRVSTLQFHNHGESEGYLSLVTGNRRPQSNTVGVPASPGYNRRSILASSNQDRMNLVASGFLGSHDTQTGFNLGGGGSSDQWARLHTGMGYGTYHALAVGPFWSNGAQRFDIAEYAPVRPEEDIEPGDVMVADETHDVRLRRLARAHEPGVIGVVSSQKTASLIIGGDTEPQQADRIKDKKPIALGGRVPVKVTLEGGPIRRGDLLAVSSTPGHAMRVADTSKGGILGTALSEFTGSDTGRGFVTVWVHLQPAPDGSAKLQDRLSAAEGRAASLERELAELRRTLRDDVEELRSRLAERAAPAAKKKGEVARR